MPTTIPVRRRAIERVDDFPLCTMVLVAFLGIALGLWGGIADETRWLEPLGSFADTGSKAPGAFDGAPLLLSGLRFAP
jgi:hypothetical protein